MRNVDEILNKNKAQYAKKIKDKNSPIGFKPELVDDPTPKANHSRKRKEGDNNIISVNELFTPKNVNDALKNKNY